MAWDASMIGQILVSGLTTGAIYALIAVGYVIIHNSTGVINLAQGEFVIFGALLMATFSRSVSLGLWPSGLLAVTLVTLLAVGMERSVIDRVRGASEMTKILLTIGVSIMLRGAALLLWGTDHQGVSSFSSGAAFEIGGIRIDRQSIWILGSTVVVLALFNYFLERTKFGKGLTACHMNAFAARIMGINPRTMSLMSFAIGGALGAFGGVMISPLIMAKYDTGLFLGLKGFVAAVLGGVSSVRGAVLGGVFLGLVESFAAMLLPSGYRDAITFLVLIIVLVVRPGGIVRAAEIKRV